MSAIDKMIEKQVADLKAELKEQLEQNKTKRINALLDLYAHRPKGSYVPLPWAEWRNLRYDLAGRKCVWPEASACPDAIGLYKSDPSIPGRVPSKDVLYFYPVIRG